tara:strand:- start:139 stop:360 length:222 start_codon:yes stop_codon:yes gene_type:complete
LRVFRSFSDRIKNDLTVGTKAENMQWNKTGITALDAVDQGVVPMRNLIEDMTSAAVIVGFIAVALSLSAAIAG